MFCQGYVEIVSLFLNDFCRCSKGKVVCFSFCEIISMKSIKSEIWTSLFILVSAFYVNHSHCICQSVTLASFGNSSAFMTQGIGPSPMLKPDKQQSGSTLLRYVWFLITVFDETGISRSFPLHLPWTEERQPMAPWQCPQRSLWWHTARKLEWIFEMFCFFQMKLQTSPSGVSELPGSTWDHQWYHKISYLHWQRDLMFDTLDFR